MHKKESEGIEMKKDIKWLKEEIEKEIRMWDGAEGGWAEVAIDEIFNLINEFLLSEKGSDWIEREKFKEKIERKRWEECSGAGEYRNGKADAYEDVLNIIDQLDKPEILSKEWIDNNSINASHDGVTDEYVHVDDLKNLVVPK